MYYCCHCHLYVQMHRVQRETQELQQQAARNKAQLTDSIRELDMDNRKTTQVCCRVLQIVAVSCSELQSVAECCRVLQSVAECCRVLQSVAVCSTF